MSWAHPEFGTVLASGSFDRTVKIWEQAAPGDTDGPQLNGGGPGPSSASRWVERAMLVDAKGTVRGVEFAPHHFGLKLVRTLRSSVSECGAERARPDARRRSRRTTTCACTSVWSSRHSRLGSLRRRWMLSPCRPHPHPVRSPRRSRWRPQPSQARRWTQHRYRSRRMPRNNNNNRVHSRVDRGWDTGRYVDPYRSHDRIVRPSSQTGASSLSMSFL